jgi:hypothetical protein
MLLSIIWGNIIKKLFILFSKGNKKIVLLIINLKREQGLLNLIMNNFSIIKVKQK